MGPDPDALRDSGVQKRDTARIFFCRVYIEDYLSHNGRLNDCFRYQLIYQYLQIM